jgi:hypothetical protein
VSDRHVFTAITGFGRRLIPKSVPYRYRLGPASSVDVERSVGDTWRSVRVDPAAASRSEQAGCDLADVADIQTAPKWDRWWLDTSLFRVPLLAGWVAASTDGPCPFDLLGPADALIFVQTPRRLPPIAEMRTPEQFVVQTGSSSRSDWIEVRYALKGVEWRQRHDVMRVPGINLVITGQAPAQDMPATAQAQDELVATLVVSDGVPK